MTLELQKSLIDRLELFISTAKFEGDKCLADILDVVLTAIQHNSIQSLHHLLNIASEVVLKDTYPLPSAHSIN